MILQVFKTLRQLLLIVQYYFDVVLMLMRHVLLTLQYSCYASLTLTH